ncbi:MAG: CobW family GTP-binding protein [Bacteroidales bacterium]
MNNELKTNISQDNNQRIPVTVITGFLGSGKTTFLNNMIKKYPKTRFAIIENEFGEMPVDGDLINHNGAPIYELSNGCICCSLIRDLCQALQSITEIKSRIDHVLIETTGIADPMSVVDLFITNNSVKNDFLINSVICLADATSIVQVLDTEMEARKQVALADMLIMNKIDCITSGNATMVKKTLSNLNPMAEIIETTYAQTNGTPLLTTQAYSGDHIEKTTLSFSNINLSLEKISHSQSIVHTQSQHRHDIHAEGFLFDECSDEELFNIWMSGFLYFNQNRLFRVKGILNFPNKKKRHVFQAVKGSYICEEGREWGQHEKRFSKIVFIGKYLDRKELEENLLKLFVKNKSPRIA